MTTAWIDGCMQQLGRRWPTIEVAQALEIAQRLSRDPARCQLSPEHCADAYVRTVEEQRDVSPSAFVVVATFAQDGAAAVQHAAAVAAATRVFGDAAVTPAAAARGWYERECWDRTGFLEAEQPTDAQLHAAVIWDRAEQAAVGAAEALGTVRCTGIEVGWR